MEILTVTNENINDIRTKVSKFINKRAESYRDFTNLSRDIFEFDKNNWRYNKDIEIGTLDEIYYSDLILQPRIILYFKPAFGKYAVTIDLNDVLELDENTLIIHRTPNECGYITTINFGNDKDEC